MISYDEALKIAIQLKSRIDKCVETPNAYLFKNVDDEYSIGGEGISCGFLKKYIWRNNYDI